MNTWGPSTVDLTHPLPYSTQGGDSGSPLYIWDEESQSYKFLASHYARGGNWNLYAYTASEWTQNTMDSFNRNVDMASAVDNTVYINAVNEQGETITEAVTTITASTTIYRGSVTTGTGENAVELTDFKGVQEGLHTWQSLSGLKDTQNWYAYGNSYMNTAEVSIADLFFTENLVFTAASTTMQNVVVNASVDLGVGYVHFTKGEDVENASFTVSAANGTDQLDSAGYLVDAGVDVYLTLTNTNADHMREWRKIGEGNLHLVGFGNNEILLNLGGKGATYLNQQGGYAAYNVLANNGTTVVINDVDQIARDFTFGNGGATLDMNGNSMDWYYTNTDVAASGFSINALTEDAIIANKSGASTLTFRESGEQTFLGSFQDTADSSLKVVYDGNGIWTLNSVYTNLVNENSGLQINNGTVILKGINTVHAPGSSSLGTGRYVNTDDWHYADARMNVNVADGATFELGSHARLTGNVDVASGGSFIMREGVKHEFEYIEGGQSLESTYGGVADYYGLKGNVHLAANADMKVEYSEGTTANTTYAGNISGKGNLTVDTGHHGATLTLTGENTFTGTKTIISGGLITDDAMALGNVTENKWLIQDAGWLASDGFRADNALLFIDSNSTGVLALSQDMAEQIDLSTHQGLIIGAQAGKTVQYGVAGTTETLTAYNNQWVLGGGEGELVVNFKLSGANDLILGNEHGKGIVKLSNEANDFQGVIKFTGGVTLDYTSLAALGKAATINVEYSNRIFAMEGVSENVTLGSKGVLLVDRATNVELDMSDHPDLFIGANEDAVYTGHIILADDAAYQFGGVTGKLTVASTLESGRDVILDGQGYFDGKVELGENALALNKTLTIKGYDDSKTLAVQEGDITLTFSANNVTNNLTGTTLLDGGIIDLAGTTQTFTNLVTHEGSHVIDSVGTGMLNMVANQDIVMAGNINVAYAKLTGEGTVTLTGTNSYEAFIVDGSNVLLGADASKNVLCADGVLEVTNGGSLSLNGYNTKGKIMLSNGGTLIATNGNTVSGVFYGDGTGNRVTVAEKGTVGFSGNMHLTAGTDLTFEGAGTVNYSATNMGGEDATIYFRSAKLQFTNKNEQIVAGTLVFDGGDVTEMRSSGSANNLTRSFDNINIAAGNTLKLTEESWNTVWNIHSLNGEGDLYWNATATHWYSSRLVLDGEGDFSGTITLNRNLTNENANRAYSDYIELAHDYAVRNATLVLNGMEPTSKAIDRIASMAVNTDNAHLAGLNGNAYSYLYAGAAYEGGGQVDGKDNSNMATAPTATRQATLTVTGSGDYNFAGQVGTANDGENGLRLVMAGTGTQTFSGANLNITGAEAQSGTLALNSAGLTVGQDISVAQGATVRLTDNGATGSWTLNAGNSLNVLDSASAASAVFDGNLVLNGGSLSFSGLSITVETKDTALLSLGSGTLSLGDAFASQTINFTDTASLAMGTYLLADGNWSVLSADSITSSGLEYMNASFSTGENGLTLTLSAKDGSSIWNGTADSHDWSATQFGQSGAVTDVAVFNNSAANKNVSITGSSAANSILIDSTEDYVFSAAAAGATVEVGSLTQEKTGTTTIESGIYVTGATTIEAGKLIVKSTDILGGEVSGAGSLGMDLGAAGSADLNAGQYNNLANLHLMSGSFTANATVTGVDTLSVTDGASLNVVAGTKLGGNLEIAGTGLANSTGSAAIVMGAGSEFNGVATLTGDAVIRNDGALTITGKLETGDYTLTKTGAGTLTLNSNNLAGSLIIDSGKLLLTNGIDFAGFSSIVMGESTILELDYGTGLNVTNLVLNEGAIVGLKNGNGSNTLLGANIVLNGNATIGGSINGNYTKVAGTITGNGTLTVNKWGGSNVWALNSQIYDGTDGQLAVNYDHANVNVNNTNAYTGGTTINGGTVNAGNLYAFGTGAVTMSNNATLTLNSELGVESLSGSGTVNANGKMLMLNVKDADANATFNGTISGNGLLIKDGAGTQTLTGAVTAQEMTVKTGELALNGATFNGSAVVMENAALTADGATVNGVINVNAGGTLNLTGELTLSDTVVNAGNVVIGEGANFMLSPTNNLYDASTLTYTIVSGGQISYGANGPIFTIDGIDASDLSETNFRLTMTDSLLSVYFNAEGLREEVTWNVTGESGVWNNSTGANQWVTNEGSVETDFKALDHVTFGADSAKNVTVEGRVSVASMTVTGDGYAFTGGEIVSAGDVTVVENASASFGEKLTVKGNLTANGDTVLSDVELDGILTSTKSLTMNGTAQVSSAAVSGELKVNGNVNFDTATITGSVNVGEGGNLTATLTNDDFSGGLTVGKDGALTLTGLNNKAIAGVTLGENATLSLTGNSTKNYTGAITMAEGSTLSVNTGNGRNTIGSGLTLEGNATIDYTRSGGSNDLLVTGALTGNGNTITKTGSGLLWLAPSSISNVSFVVEEGLLRLGGSVNNAIPTGVDSVTLRSGTELSFTAKTSSLATNLSFDGGSAMNLRGSGSTKAAIYSFTGAMDITATDSSYVSIYSVAERTLNLDGAITGTGGLKFTGTTANGNDTDNMIVNLNNAGNTFEGGIAIERANVTVNLKDAAAAGTGEIMLGRTNSALVYNGTESVGSASAMNNVISGSGTVTVNSGHLAFSAEQTYTGVTTVKNGAALSLQGTGSIQAGTSVTIGVSSNPAPIDDYLLGSTFPASTPESTLTNVTVTGSGMSATDTANGAVGTVTNGQVTVHANPYAITNVDLVDTNLVSSVESGVITMTNVNMNAGSTIMGNNLTKLTLDDVVYSVSADAQASLVDGAAYGVAGHDIYVFTLYNFADLDLSGNLTLDFSGLYQMNGSLADSLFAIDFGSSVKFNENLTVKVDSGNGTDSVVTLTGSSVVVGVVPEPGTVSLSLLGLAGLLLRRRRNG